MPTHDIIDNRSEKLVDHINRMLDSTEFARFAVGYFFLSGLESIAERLDGVKELRLLIGNTTNRETLEQLAEGYRRLELVQDAIEAQTYPKRTEMARMANETATSIRSAVEQMDQTTEEKPVAVMVQRGKDHIRLETRIVLPKRQPGITARVQGQHLADLKQVQIVSRAVTAMRLILPEAWLPAVINWNGSEMVRADAPGCWMLEVQKELMSGRKCP